MPLVLIAAAAVLILAAYNNTHGTLAAALGQDVPGFAPWALAIGATGAVGFIPGMQTVSRGLTSLLFLVIVLRNWPAISTGITDLQHIPAAGPATAATDPATQFATTGPFAVQTAAVTGTAAGTGAAGPAGPVPGVAGPAAPSFADPQSFVAAIESGFGGFGGHA
jgi:hypothetical protein